MHIFSTSFETGLFPRQGVERLDQPGQAKAMPCKAVCSESFLLLSSVGLFGGCSAGRAACRLQCHGSTAGSRGKEEMATEIKKRWTRRDGGSSEADSGPLFLLGVFDGTEPSGIAGEGEGAKVFFC